MDQEQFEDAKQRYQNLLPTITNIKDRVARRDLIKFSKICVNNLEKISREEVRCRQLRRVTESYIELLQNYIDSVDLLEKYAILAVLSDG